jgi:hypothetical protein
MFHTSKLKNMPRAGIFDILTDWIFRLIIGGNYVQLYEDEIVDFFG